MDFNKTKSKLLNFLSGRGFYIILAGCLIALGVAAWATYTTVVTVPEVQNSSEPNSTVEESLPPESEQVQNDTLNEEPYYEPEEESSTPTTTEPEEEIINTVADYFVFPFSGNIIKPFSDSELSFSETFGDMRVHTGLDIAADLGITVGSCGNGIVLGAENDPLWGWVIKIDHGNGIIVHYCGLGEDLLVEEGDIVSAGSPLGYLSSVPCESSEEVHLHLEFYKDGIPENPENIIG